MYAPKVRRDVFLVCFDTRHRVALLRAGPPGAGGRWALPAGRRSDGESHVRAARRLASVVAPLGGVHFGGLTGRFKADTGGVGAGPHRSEAWIFTVHLGLASALPHVQGKAELRWVPYRQIPLEVRHLGIPDLELFLEGYVEGWIPDGWITLC
ncbi:NUDIX hydrolase [Streptomyces sp. ISL-43]|uniref:NUDIX hydrolase n=1 Tax=Streptomyces sp. ISL-43 TaxID=2819183 RepID=UPI001C14FF67|nr:NUDIX hydrolase [Streptomyces sp. ISL-43]